MHAFSQLSSFVCELFKRRQMISEMAKQDFKEKYLGSYLGIVWAFINPIVYICILWFVFQLGFKSQPAGDTPFVIWMLCGIIPWFFFSECLATGANSIIEKAFLLKKINFNVALLPIVKILSSLILHAFFLLCILIMLILYRIPFSVHALQVCYYLFAMLVLLLGLSWLTSSVSVFFRDMGQLIPMTTQFLFWLTPIFWPAKLLPVKYLNLVKLNPVYYIIEGYRDSFINHVWFWKVHPWLTLYFWVVTCSIFVLGAVVFKRLRPHFADVL
jgi:lipopolysaccharide transport system permease protein/teichoic acid transport system permease protein